MFLRVLQSMRLSLSWQTAPKNIAEEIPLYSIEAFPDQVRPS